MGEYQRGRSWLHWIVNSPATLAMQAFGVVIGSVLLTSATGIAAIAVVGIVLGVLLLIFALVKATGGDESA